jgi:hypothetical protein
MRKLNIHENSWYTNANTIPKNLHDAMALDRRKMEEYSDRL